MGHKLRDIGAFLSKTEVILVTYLSFKCIQILYSINNQVEENSIILIRFLVFVVMAILCYLTYKKHKIASWVNSIIIFIGSVGTLILGVAVIPFDQIWMKLLFILIGAYFTLGSVVIFKRTKQQNMSTILNT